MSENEKRLRGWLALGTRAAMTDVLEALDALLAEHRAEVERLAEEKAEAERYRDSWRRRWSGDVGSARDAALEEAAKHHDRKGDGARAWLDEHEQRAKANVVASWRTSLEVHRWSAVAIRDLKSQPAERYLPESEVQEVFNDIIAVERDRLLMRDLYPDGSVPEEAARRLGVDLDADGGPLKRCDLHDDCSRPEEGRKP